MFKNRISANACWPLALMCVSLFHADAQAYRKPLGVYAHVDIDAAIARHPCSDATTVDQLHTCLRGLYSGLLNDLAISGIAAGAHWDHIQISEPLCAFFNA